MHNLFPPPRICFLYHLISSSLVLCLFDQPTPRKAQCGIDLLTCMGQRVQQALAYRFSCLESISKANICPSITPCELIPDSSVRTGLGTLSPVSTGGGYGEAVESTPAMPSIGLSEALQEFDRATSDCSRVICAVTACLPWEKGARVSAGLVE